MNIGVYVENGGLNTLNIIDRGMPKLVEAENEVILVEEENGI